MTIANDSKIVFKEVDLLEVQLHNPQVNERFVCTVEELYQYFKKRLMDDVISERPSGELVNKKPNA